MKGTNRDMEKEVRQIQKDFQRDIKSLEKKYRERIRNVHDSLRTYDDIIKGNKIALGVIKDIKKEDISRGVSEKIFVPVRKEFGESVDIIRKIATDLPESQGENIVEDVLGKRDGIRAVSKSGAGKETVPEKAGNEIPEKKVQEKEMPEQKHGKPSIDRLFEEVARKGVISPVKAASLLNVHKVQIDEWSSVLRKNRLIEITKEGNLKKRVV